MKYIRHKTWAAVLLSIAAIIGLCMTPPEAYGADNPSECDEANLKPGLAVPGTTEFYRGGEFQIDLFGSLATPDLDNYQSGAGLGLNYYLSKNIGIGATIAGDWSEHGQVVDSAGGSLLYRIPIERSAITFRGGATWDLRREGWSLELGPGLEHRFTRHIGIFTEALLSKRIDEGDVHAVGRAGIRLAF